MLRENLTVAIEDYLKTIHELTLTDGRATTNRIAECLEVTPASVTGMIQRLASADPPLVAYHKHHGAKLTPDGERAALEVIRHHRLLETFLQQTLGYTWDEVHAEADRLEHVISEELEERIAQSLGNPTQDPHGEPIPNRELQLPEQSWVRLSDLAPGQRAAVQRVGSPTPELLRYLSSIGMVPTTGLAILDRSEFDDNLRIQIENQPEPVVLGLKVTQQVYVEVV